MKDNAVPSFASQQLGPELSQLARTVFRLSRRFKRQLNGPLEAKFQLGLQDLACLVSVQRGINTPSQLAEYQGLPAPTTSRIVARLEGRGLVQRGAVAGDLRRCQLALTPQGEQLLEQMRAEMAALLAGAYGDLDPELVDETLQNLRQLERRLGSECGPPESVQAAPHAPTNAARHGDARQGDANE